MRSLPLIILAVAAGPALGQPAMPTSTATFINLDGSTAGQATLIETDDGLFIQVAVRGLTDGPHGFHIHSVGTCDDRQAGFMASKGHVKAEGEMHGLVHPSGPELGDLPNLFSSGGVAQAQFETPRVSLTGAGGRPSLLDQDGSALVIHAGPDDQMTQPIGNSGGRVMCAVVGPVGR